MTTPTPETLRELLIPYIAITSEEVRRRIAAAADAWQLLIDAVNDDNGECLPECNSFGHAEGCQYVDMAGTLVRLKERLAEAEKVCEEAERVREKSSGYLALQRALAGWRKVAAIAYDKEKPTVDLSAHYSSVDMLDYMPTDEGDK